ncbi:LamG-like jellyroll fold domain-containing protein [Planctomycetota bacterium]
MSNKAIPKMYLIIVLAFLISMGRDANADFVFGTPSNLGPTVNSSHSDGVPSISSDGLSLFFNSARPGGYGDYDLWVTTRATTEGDWGTPTNLGATVNSSGSDGGPSISADGLTLFFASARSGGHGNFDLWVTIRATTEDDWGTPVNLGPSVNSSYLDSVPCISGDNLSLFFMSNRPGGSGGDDIWVTTRETIHDDWSAPVNLGPTINSSTPDGFPYISDDGLLLFFTSFRAGGYGSADMWLAKWNTKDYTWDTPVNLGSVINSSMDELAVCISDNGSTLFFSSRRSGGFGDQDIWQVPIEPIVDLNGDGIVDAADMCIMVDYWGTDEPLCDIGPMPWGDGIVDVQDLIVLSEHLFEDVNNDHTLVAHWALDEIEGFTAHDSVNGHDDYIMGGAVWQPAGGVIDGALELDGVDDCLIATFGPNPAAGPFSVVAWIKGGAPGQVIFSQSILADWLMIDASTGTLMTELKSSDGLAGPLLSETAITNGQWHRIGLVWDGSHRMLCVDGVTVAEDMQDGLEASAGGLYVGVGKYYTPGTFFSGLIDDVRIYNRAISP